MVSARRAPLATRSKIKTKLSVMLRGKPASASLAESAAPSWPMRGRAANIRPNRGGEEARAAESSGD